MVVMEALNEAEILHNIRVRYAKTMIFTYIGPTLIVM
jgi:myosin-7